VAQSTTIAGRDVNLFWSCVGSESVVVIAHGLGGHVNRPYVLGTVRAFNRVGCDAVAWHVWEDGDRDMAPHLSHGGATDGLRGIVHHLASQYRRVFLVGFSLGGNVVLKYLGEEEGSVIAAGAVAFSVPCDLESAAHRISEPDNHIYQSGFLRRLKRVVRQKSLLTPDQLSTDGLEEIDSLMAFDDRYTAPLNGFRNAHDYYTRCSSGSHLNGIRTPTLLVNARNDPFLTASCYPVEMCLSHDFVFLEMPESGGHVGFPLGRGVYWSEERALEFLSNQASLVRAESTKKE